MSVDISLQFNGHNSYRATDVFRSQPFGVQGMSWITHSLHAMANSSLASAVRAETRFYNANGILLSKVSHSFAVGTVWDKVIITVAVPALAMKAQLSILPGPTTWWWVEAKSEEGQTATPYNINYAGQLTKLSPAGVYTGLLSAEQIVIRGTQLNPEEYLGERLVTINSTLLSMTADLGAKGQRITNIEAGQITLSNTLRDKTTRIDERGIYTGEIKADQIEGGVIRATNPVTYGPFTQADVTKVYNHLNGLGTLTSAERLRYDVNSDGRITVTDMVVMNAMIDGRQDPVRTVKPVIRIEPQSLGFEGGIFFGNEDDVDSESSSFYMSGGVFSGREVNTSKGTIGSIETNVISGIGTSGGFSFMDGYAWSHKLEVNYLGAGMVYTSGIHTRDSVGIHFYDAENRHRVGIYGDSRGMQMLDSAGRLRMAYDVNASYMVSPNGSNQLGVDNGGVNITGNATIGGLLNGMQMITYGSGGRGIGLPNGFRMAFETDKINFLNKNGHIIHTIQ